MNYEEKYEEILDLYQYKKLEEAYQKSLELIQQDKELSYLCVAVELAVEVNEFYSAVNLCTALIQQSLDKNDNWYLSTTYLLRAFSFIKLGKFKEAMTDINEVCIIEEDSEVFWLQNHNTINKENILKMIKNNPQNI